MECKILENYLSTHKMLDKSAIIKIFSNFFTNDNANLFYCHSPQNLYNVDFFLVDCY